LSPGERLAVVFAWAVPVLILSIGKHLSLPLSAVSAWALIVVAWRRAEAAPAPGIIAPAGVETQTETPITTI
jgi:hypothetical protein